MFDKKLLFRAGRDISAGHTFGRGVELYIWNGTEAQEFRTYKNTLSGVYGVELYDSSTVGNNSFVTFTVGEGLLHIGYFQEMKMLRVIYDPLIGSCPPPVEPEEYKKVCEPKFTVPALDYSSQKINDANGMSYIFTLEDGSYVIYDGGTLNDSTRLYTYLLDHSSLPEHKIVISAWILTHSHTDHFRCFVGFTRLYSEKVSVRYFVLNSPAEDPEIIETKRYNGFLTNEFPSFAEKYKGAKIITAHTGQHIELAGASIEILLTYEDIYPEKCDWLNEASLVTRVTVAGQTFYMSADSELKSNRRIEEYGHAIKSDFFQFPHHGYSGCTETILNEIKPRIVTWTTNYECYTLRTVKSWKSKVNLYLMDVIKPEYSFVADGVCKILKLPFKGTDDIEFYNYPEPAAIRLKYNK